MRRRFKRYGNIKKSQFFHKTNVLKRGTEQQASPNFFKKEKKRKEKIYIYNSCFRVRRERGCAPSLFLLEDQTSLHSLIYIFTLSHLLLYTLSSTSLYSLLYFSSLSNLHPYFSSLSTRLLSIFRRGWRNLILKREQRGRLATHPPNNKRKILILIFFVPLSYCKKLYKIKII